MLKEEQFRENLTEVTRQIERFCLEFNRSPDEVALLPVTKKWPSEAVRFCQRAKFGLLSEQVDAVLERALACSNLLVEGLMTIAPYAPGEPAVSRRAFVRLRELRDRLNGDFNLGMKELSMGMSGDLREAIESGSTMVRVGSALFGQRGE